MPACMVAWRGERVFGSDVHYNFLETGPQAGDRLLDCTKDHLTIGLILSLVCLSKIIDSETWNLYLFKLTIVLLFFLRFTSVLNTMTFGEPL